MTRRRPPPQSFKTYRAKLDELIARRSVLMRRLTAAGKATERAAKLCDRAFQALGCEQCTERVDADLHQALQLSERACKRLHKIRKRLECVIDELNWIQRRYNLYAPSPNYSSNMPQPTRNAA